MISVLMVFSWIPTPQVMWWSRYIIKKQAHNLNANFGFSPLKKFLLIKNIEEEIAYNLIFCFKMENLLMKHMQSS